MTASEPEVCPPRVFGWTPGQRVHGAPHPPSQPQLECRSLAYVAADGMGSCNQVMVLVVPM
jgi:hypothetical protein